LQSFCPTGGDIKRVTIYLSDFGKERMETESKHGPQWLWDESLITHTKNKQAAVNKDKSSKKGDFVREEGHVGIVFDEDDDGQDLDIINKHTPTTTTDNNTTHDEATKKEIQNVLLRKYELSKLRYYFAIAECSSVAVAEALYEQLDGVEMEASSMVFDLRFVPEDIDFQGRKVKDQSNGDKISPEL
jgi:hypothetical protein